MFTAVSRYPFGGAELILQTLGRGFIPLVVGQLKNLRAILF